MIRVGLIGAAGRMGRTIIRSIAMQHDIKLVAALSPENIGEDAGTCADLPAPLGVTLSNDPHEFFANNPNVVLDFSVPQAVPINGVEVIKHKIPYIIGVSSIPLTFMRKLKDECKKQESTVLIVPNFSIGANLMIKFSVAAAKYLPHVEIIERHHAGKLDAPSGTASWTAQKICKNNPHLERHVSQQVTIDGVRGGVYDNVHIHSVRLPGYLAEQEVLMGNDYELLTIDHRVVNRDTYIPGVMLALRNIGKLSGFNTGLDLLLDI